MWPDFMTIAPSCLPKFCPRFFLLLLLRLLLLLQQCRGNFDDLWMNQHEFVERSSSKTRLTGLWWRNAGTVTPLHKPPRPAFIQGALRSGGFARATRPARTWLISMRQNALIATRLSVRIRFISTLHLVWLQLVSLCSLLKMCPLFGGGVQKNNYASLRDAAGSRGSWWFLFLSSCSFSPLCFS